MQKGDTTPSPGVPKTGFMMSGDSTLSQCRLTNSSPYMGAKQKLDFVGKKSKSMLAIRKLRKFDDDFEVDDFLVMAQDVYMKAHNALMNVRKDKEELLLHVTEKAYPEMLHNAMDKTIHWKMLGLLEPLRLVQARTLDVISKENLFCQMTVRFHTQQMLAVYDRFGRLIYGSEILAKDVLEYIVFEKHLANRYGNWRVHAKIIPDWMPAKEPAPKTFRLVEEDEKQPQSPTSDSSLQKTKELPPSEMPALATA
ncbi:39S ribosomal protein L45, mitochondrial [Homalodisca vitripennis]|nr:39S ribosomal protein L45, mitochondrial [Homalodisca vitripennis]